MSLINKIRLPYREDTAFGFITLCVILVPLAFSLYTSENYEVVKYSLFLFLTGATVISFALSARNGEVNFFYNKKLFILLGGFILWALLGSIFSINLLHSFFGIYYRLTNGLLFFVTFIAFLILILNLANEAKVKYLLKILVFDALIVALVGFASAFNFIIYGGSEVGGFFRGPSLLGNSDYSAMFLACIFPLAIYFFLQSKNFWTKVYYAITAFWVIFIVFILASRGALLGIGSGLFVVIILLFIYKFEKKVIWTVLAVVLIAIGLGRSVIFTSRPQAVSSVVGNVVDSNTSLRLEVWKISLKGIIKRPLLGVGLGNYPIFFEKNRPEDIAGQVNVFDDAHNLYLHMAVTGGLPLILFFLAVILLAYYKGLLNLKTEKDLLSVFLMGCLTSWLICVSFNPVPVPMYLFLAVLIAGLFLKHQKSFPFKPSVKVKSILLLAGSLVSIFAILVLSSDVLFAKAFRLYSEKDYDGAYKFSNMAATLNPTNEWILTVRADSVVHLNLGKDKVEDAINRIKKARKNEADSWVISGDIYYLLYQTKGDKQNLALAISNIQEALKVDPYFAERYGQLALYQYQNGQFGEAKLSLFKELGLFDKDFSAWILLAKIYQNEGNKSATIASLNKAFKIHPESNQLKYIIYLAKYFPDIKRVSIPVVSPQQ